MKNEAAAKLQKNSDQVCSQHVHVVTPDRCWFVNLQIKTLKSANNDLKTELNSVKDKSEGIIVEINGVKDLTVHKYYY